MCTKRNKLGNTREKGVDNEIRNVFFYSLKKLRREMGDETFHGMAFHKN